MEWLKRGIEMVFIDNPTVSSDYIRQMMKTAADQDIVTRTAMESTKGLPFCRNITRRTSLPKSRNEQWRDSAIRSDTATITSSIRTRNVPFRTLRKKKSKICSLRCLTKQSRNERN